MRFFRPWMRNWTICPYRFFQIERFFILLSTMHLLTDKCATLYVYANCVLGSDYRSFAFVLFYLENEWTLNLTDVIAFCDWCPSELKCLCVIVKVERFVDQICILGYKTCPVSFFFASNSCLCIYLSFPRVFWTRW